jgi:hypothetical protein
MSTPQPLKRLNVSVGQGIAQRESNRTVDTFLAALGSGAVVFAVEFLLFYFLKDKFTRI